MTLILGIVSTALLISISSAVITHYREVRNAAATMDFYCRSEKDAVNQSLASVEQSVKLLKCYAESLPSDSYAMTTDIAGREEYMGQLLHMFKGIASETEGCMSYFFRFNPDGFSGDEGFFYSMEYGSETLSEGFAQMDISPINVDDAGNNDFDWFFKPLETGIGTWISPHFQDEVKMKVITFAEPVYLSGKAVGVLGMNLDFDNLLQKIRQNRLYETGSVFLVGTDGSVMGVNGGSDTEEADLFIDKLAKFSSNGKTIPYTYDGVRKHMVYSTLINAMRLVITARSSEIYAGERQMIIIGLSISALTALLLVIIGFQNASLITRPLRNLAEATSKVNGKNFKIEMPEKGREDEIGELARAMQETMDKAQEYSDYVEGLAYKDSLTGMNNKTAYDIREKQLNEQILSGNAEFAIAMVDLNFLKKVNDQYGHRIGNQYILNLCDKLMGVFPRNNIYRVGGDEFVVILTGSLYARMDELIEEVRQATMISLDDNTEPWTNASAAVGLAVYTKNTDNNMKAVFDRADADMYTRKLAMKAQRV
jgi:diguanylate cyclase (GGDEF)-like protein